jgi:hypothetical protein
MFVPGDKDRLTIVGATGSGKTYAAMYHLSQRNYNVKPWIVYDFKGEELIGSIQGAQYLDLSEPLPQRPGVYIVQPAPGDEEVVDVHMNLIWQAEDIGVFIDEGYMVGQRSIGFRRLLTQGRSKHIPMIINSQRPVYMDRFVFSESTFFQVFRLQHSDDVKTTEKFIPHNLSKRLQEFHSYFYSVRDDKIVVMRPGPDANAILDTFETRMPKMRKVI